MKSPFRFLLLFLLLSSVAAAQNKTRLLSRAVELARYVEKDEGHWFFKEDSASAAQYMPLLAECLGSFEGGTYRLVDDLRDNPFIGGSTNEKARVTFNQSAQSLGNSISRMRPSTEAGRSPSGLSVTSFADALAKFLVVRTKEELSITFFEKFQEQVQRDPLLTLFPATSNTLGVIGRDIYQFSPYLEAMHESFDKDLRTLPVNVKTFLVNKQLVNNPYRSILAEDGLDLAQFLVDGMSPDSILAWLASDAAMQQLVRQTAVGGKEHNHLLDLAAGFQTVNLFSESLRSDDDARIWEPSTAIDAAFANEPAMYIYLGLLWQAGHDIQFSNKKGFREILGGMNQYDALRLCLRDFTGHARDVSQSMIRFNEPLPLNERTQVGYDRFYPFVNGFLGMLEAGLNFKANVAQLTDGEMFRADTLLLGSVRHLNDLHLDVRQRRYAAAINDMMYVLDLYLQKDFPYRKEVFKYGHFIATVAEAQNSDQIALAIDAVALPPGSARLKKEAAWSVTINAYTGFSGGTEHLEKTGAAGFASLSAPVGLGVNRGIGGRQSLSLFVPIVDVGALAAYRFGNDDASALPALEWSNLVAPGIWAVWGFKRQWPLVLGIGAQRGPNLRKIDSAANPDIKTDAGWRFGGFLSVDIPVFNIYAR